MENREWKGNGDSLQPETSKRYYKRDAQRQYFEAYINRAAGHPYYNGMSDIFFRCANKNIKECDVLMDIKFHNLVGDLRGELKKINKRLKRIEQLLRREK